MPTTRLPPLPVVIMRYVFQDGFSTRATAVAEHHLQEILDAASPSNCMVIVRVNISVPQ